MLHEPAAPVGKDPAAAFKSRLGVWMFLAYSLFYAGFVAVNLHQASVDGSPGGPGDEPGDCLRFSPSSSWPSSRRWSTDAICRSREHAMRDQQGEDE